MLLRRLYVCLALFATCLHLLSGPARAQEPAKIEVIPNIPHSAIKSVAFSPDGMRVLSGSWDKTLKLWDAATGKLIRTFEGHSDYVHSVAFSPDGMRVLSGSWDKTLKLWDAATGKLIRTFGGHTGEVKSVTFSPVGTRLLSGSGDKTLKLWDVASGKLIRTFGGHSDDVGSVAFSFDGTRLLSGSHDKTLKLWDAVTGKLIRTFSGHGSSVGPVAFSPDGTRLLSGSGDKTLKLWDAATGKLMRTFEGHSDIVWSVAFSPDGASVLSGSSDRTLRLWDAETGKLIRTFGGDSTTVASVAFSPGGTHLLSGGGDTLKLWDAASGKLIRTFGGHSYYSVSSVAFSPDGTRILSGGNDRTLKLWDAESGRLIRTFGADSGEVNSVAFSPNGTRVLSGGNNRTLKLWELASGELIRTFEGHSDAVWSVAISPDGTRVLSGSQDRTLKLWDAATGELIRTFGGHSYSVRSVAFSPNGTRVLSGSFDNTLKLWDAATGKLIRTFERHSRPTSVVFSPDGTRILSGGWDEALKLWEAATGKLIRTFEGRSDEVYSVAFSPDGTRVLSSGYTVKLWDAATGKLIRGFKGHDRYVRSVAFSPDGTRVLSGDRNMARVWNATSGELLASLLIDKRSSEWLTITPEGFFDASPKGIEILGVVRGLDLTTIDQVHQSLFNPDLVREALAGDPGGEVAEAAKVINLEKVLDSGPAPSVAIASPAGGSQLAADLVEVTAEIEDRGKGVGRIEWRVNGVTAATFMFAPDHPRASSRHLPAPAKAGVAGSSHPHASEPAIGWIAGKRRAMTGGAAKPAGGPVYAVTQHLALDLGENTIEVVAYNGSNLLASLPARTVVKFTGPADKIKPKLHILAIGINAYMDKGWAPPGGKLMGFGPLGLAVKDATAFAATMKKAAADLYDEVRVTLALDKDATRDNLHKLVDKIAADIHLRDTFILFAAAHGMSENGRFHLIPQDYQSGPPGTLAERAIRQDDLQDWLANRIKARKAIVLLDTCESGALIAGHGRSRTDTPISETGVGRLHEATGRPVLTAAAADQEAKEGWIGTTGVRHGYFTWALLDGLRHGDSNGNGLIELSELVAHVQAAVPKIAAGKNIRGLATIAAADKQSARFGSRGEDFAVAKRLQ